MASPTMTRVLAIIIVGAWFLVLLSDARRKKKRNKSDGDGQVSVAMNPEGVIEENSQAEDDGSNEKAEDEAEETTVDKATAMDETGQGAEKCEEGDGNKAETAPEALSEISREECSQYADREAEAMKIHQNVCIGLASAGAAAIALASAGAGVGAAFLVSAGGAQGCKALSRSGMSNVKCAEGKIKECLEALCKIEGSKENIMANTEYSFVDDVGTGEMIGSWDMFLEKKSEPGQQ